jgi:5-hydroxyisourate hydrolase
MRIAARVVDTTYGRSAAGVRARLERACRGGWTTLADAETDAGGCIEEWNGSRVERGLYRVVFGSDRYFAGLGEGTAYPEVAVMFRTRSESGGCQLQVALSPYSYSTYVGIAGAVHGLLGQEQQGAQRAPQRRVPLGGWLLGGEDPDQIMKPVVARRAGCLDELGPDQVIERWLARRARRRAMNARWPLMTTSG